MHEARDCRYAVYDVQYQTSEGGRRGKLAFIHFCPDEASIKRKVRISREIAINFTTHSQPFSSCVAFGHFSNSVHVFPL